MSAHTPGPWRAEGPFMHWEAESRYEVLNNGGMVLALCAFDRGDEEARVATEADARLIAAAPDMANLLKRMLGGDVSRNEVREVLEKAGVLT